MQAEKSSMGFSHILKWNTHIASLRYKVLWMVVVREEEKMSALNKWSLRNPFGYAIFA